MSNIIRIKRRLDDGSVSAVSGAPASLYNAEMAFNEVDNTLYYGRGDNGSGVANEVVAIGGKGYIDTLVSNTSASLLNTINTNLSTVLGADIESLTENLNSINELAQSLSGDAQFAVSVNDRINTLNQSSGNLTPRVGALEANFQTLTSYSGITTLGTIADQDSNNVDITGGTISVSTLTVTGDSSVAGLSASGALDVAGKATLKGAVDITGAVDMASTLDVTGAATLNGGATIVGAASVSEGLTVTGVATLNGGATIGGSTTLASLSVTGASVLDSTLSVAAKATVESLEVTNAAVLNSTLSVAAKATVESLEVTNDADFKSDVRVDGTFEVGSGAATLFVENGKVGINTETPSEVLDVVGNGKFSGNLMGTSGTSLITGFIMDGGSF